MLKRIHLIGVCGTAMATLAALLKSKGYDVRGSDQNVYPPMSDFLVAAGHHARSRATAPITHRGPRSRRRRQRDLARQPGARGSPGSQDPLLLAARSGPRPLSLGRRGRSCIAGTHGKTTTTSLAGWLLAHGGADPIVFIGGIAENFESSYRIGGGRDFVIEGDEYDSAFFDKTAKFLKYLPDIAVVNNIEFDHADIYPDLDAIRLAFRRLVNLVPRRGLLLLGADNADALALKGTRAARSRHSGCRPEPTGRRTILKVAASRRGSACGAPARRVGTFELPLLGAYNVRNALAAIAVGAAAGLEHRHDGGRACGPSKACAAGSSIAGPRRGSRCTTISRTIRPRSAKPSTGVRSAYPDRRIWAIFEPRSATSCRRMFQADFARALARADRVILPAVFRSTSRRRRAAIDRSAGRRTFKSSGSMPATFPTSPEIVRTVAQRRARWRPGHRDVEWRLRRHSSEAPRGARGARPLTR